MIKPSLLLILSTPLAFGIDAYSSVEDFFGGREYDPKTFTERDLDEQKLFAPMSPADSDLGNQVILAREIGRAKIRLDFESQIFWSDNLGSTSVAEESGLFWMNRADLSWRPRIGNNLFFDTFLEAETYFFDSDAELDFESYTLGLGLVKIIHDLDDLLLYGRYEFQRVSVDRSRFVFSPIPDDADYHRVRFGAHKVFLSKPQHTAYVAADVSFSLDANSPFLERNEYAVSLGYSFHPTDDLKATFFYRFAERDFKKISRNDTLQTAGVELSYAFSKKLSIYASATWADNDSDVTFINGSYETSQVGAGIAYTHRF